MAKTKLVNREQYATSVDKTLKEKFIQLSKDTRIPASKLIDEAIEDLLKKYDFVELKPIVSKHQAISYAKIMESEKNA